MPELFVATTPTDFDAAATLFQEYANWLDIDLGFQNFEKEIQALDAMYAWPKAGIILCREQGVYIGCVAVRPLEDDTAEMKRMWLRPDQQSKGLGQLLLNSALELARTCGYKKIKLDTLNHMTPAINLYRKNGFIETTAYYYNPDARAIYFEKLL